MCCSSFKLLVAAPNSYITLPQYQPTMSCKNPLESRPWNPGCGMTPIGTTYVASKMMDYCAEKYKQGTPEFNASKFDASLKRWNAFWDDYFIP